MTFYGIPIQFKHIRGNVVVLYIAVSSVCRVVNLGTGEWQLHFLYILGS